ncbi:MAG TPA: hypothetical protein VNU47_02530, partial [Candidatus Paceibacterota bacterium]|nr:hypothetical protein [Candidatus Paceibacterota bacterium]
MHDAPPALAYHHAPKSRYALYLRHFHGIVLIQITVSTEKIRINREIRARELRVIGANGENLGVISTEDAIKAAEAAGLD